MKKILVAGGAGFIGSNLCEVLVSQGHSVVCVDNLYSGTKKNITNLLKYDNFQFINHDIIEKLNIEVDEIYNFACPASPKYYQKDPIFTLKTNFLGVLNLLNLAKKNNAKFLQSSTSEIYGDPLEHPQKESYRGNVNPIGIRACYDEGKRVAETLIFDYIRKFNINAKVVRIFNTYGPKMGIEDGRVVSNFIVQALKKEPLTVYGNGNQTRSFCYITDMIDALLKTMNSEIVLDRPINLGNESEISINQLTKHIHLLLNEEKKIIYMPLPSDDPHIRKPDIENAKNLLGWRPRVQIEEGLSLTIEYFRKSILDKEK